MTSAAKINLGLLIPFRYDNGYHHIISLLAKINFSDELTIHFNQSNTLTFDFKNELPDAFQKLSEAFTTVENNILFDTFQWLKTFDKNKPWGAHIEITKRVPSPCGLGGGSSNAATFIKAYYQQFELNSSAMAEMNKASLKIGADVPFFLAETSLSLISGIGEVIAGYALDKPIYGLLAIPSFGMSTALMYQKLDENSENTMPTLPYSPLSVSIRVSELADKSSLQSDPNARSILSQYRQNFADLAWFFCYADDKYHEKVRDIMLFENGNHSFLIRNEFYAVAKRLFRDEATIINSAITKMQSKYQELVKVEESNMTLSSLSGSGSSFYMIVKSSGDANMVFETLNCLQEEMQKDFPDIFWKVFCIK